MRKLPLQLFVLFLGIETIAQDKRNEVLPNENLIAENIAPISKELLQKVKKYTETRGAGLSTVHPIKDEVIVFTRFGSTNQLHKVTQPLGTRTQITFLKNLLPTHLMNQ
nr:hypothetical protein [Flavobacterium covae]